MDYARIDCATSNGLYIMYRTSVGGHGAQYQCYSCYSAGTSVHLLQLLSEGWRLKPEPPSRYVSLVDYRFVSNDVCLIGGPRRGVPNGACRF